MNEKSNPMPMMYKTIPAVAELNKVPGFDPLKFLRHKVSRKTNEEMLQLELPYQKLWFRLRHPQGRMKLTTLRITEQLAIMEARVYLDRSDAEPISSYISQHSAEEGLDIPLKQKDDPPDKAGAKYIWFSSSSKNMGVTSGSPVHFIGDPSARVVYVIEGLLKADISHCLTNRTFVAIAGANNTSQLDTLFALLAQNGTEEIIEAHDMDKYSNQMTSNGASKIYLMARKNGMACRRLTWNPNYKGFDDWQLALREKEQKEKEVQRMNFKQQYLCGKCDFTYIDGCVELWHTRAEKDLDLTEYLGLTKEEYQIFLAQGNQALKDILDSQRVFRRFCIYQLCLGETQTVPFAFKQLDALRKAGYEQPPAAAYQTVWSAEVCCPKGQNDMEVLGRLFLDYNEHLPEDYRGRPLAPSDVVELDCQGKRTYFYVNDCRDFAPVRFSPFLCKRLPEPAQKQE